MSIDILSKILNLLPPQIAYLDFSHRGDPTMNPNFPEMVRLARQRGFAVDAYTNGLILDKFIPDLVESGLNVLRIDLDGGTEKSYLQYRQGGDYQRVKDNIRKLVAARARSVNGSPKRIIILCVVTAFNEHEIPRIQKLARELGVDELLFKTAIVKYGAKYYNSAQAQDRIVPQNNAYRRPPRPKNFICPNLWRGSIFYNGDLDICCADFEGTLVMGNILEKNSFNKVYFSRRATKIRKAVLRQAGSICQTCAIVDKSHYIASIGKKFS